jgi:hypothetical protein
MALNISLLLVPWPIFLMALILIVAAIIVLTIIEVKLGKQAKTKKNSEETYYQRKLSTVLALSSDPNGFLIALDKVVREFFSEMMGKNTTARYAELIDYLKQTQKNREADFCQEMQEVLYAGEKIDHNILNELYSKMKYFVTQKEKVELMRQVGQQRSQQVKQSDVNEHILRYVKEGKERGFEMNYLRQKLVEEGLDEAEIDKVLTHLDDKEKERVKVQTEKQVLTNFFNPKNKDLEIIKKSVEEKDDMSNGEIIEIVPYREEKPETKEENVVEKKVVYPKSEPEGHKRIENFDNLDRIREKIRKRKERLEK